MTTWHSSKDEAANLDWALMALAKNAGYVLPSEKATAIQEVLETQEKRIAALERENAVLEENAIRFREERDRLRQSQSHEPLKHRILQDRADDLIRELQRQGMETMRIEFLGKVLTVSPAHSSSETCDHDPMSHGSTLECDERGALKCTLCNAFDSSSQNTEDRCEHGVWKADHCYQCAKSE